ncbi:MAG TPA: DUF4215 domain-containing protein [Candidatus Binatia bacterium]|jgi:cysteine-rich repeat protein/parallel beta-helix repeat protein
MPQKKMRGIIRRTRVESCIAVAALLLRSGTAAAAVLAVPSQYSTIQAAVNAAGPGDTVEVATGTYNEKVTFPSSGTAGNPITLRAKAGNTPVIDGTGIPTTDLVGLIYIENQSYITVSGMQIANLTATNASDFPAGIWVRGTSHDIQLLGNTVHDIRNPGCASCGAHGIAAYGTNASGSIHNLVIDGNEVRNCVLGWSESMVVNGNVEQFSITNNRVHDNNNIGIDAIGFEGECVGCSDALDRARDGLIAGNLVYDIDSLGNPSYGNDRSADGIYVDGGTRITIERNVVHDSNIGIELASEHAGKDTSDVVVRSNFVYRSQSIGIAIGGYDTRRGSTSGCSIVHNTLYDNDTDQYGGGELLLQYDISGNTIENNVVYANSQDQFVANEFSLTSGNTIDHNIYFSTAGAASSSWIWKTTPYTGFGAWQAGSGNDAHSVFVDPELVSPATGNLHLSAASPAIGAAVALAAGIAGTQDIDGDPRVSGAAADIGADELACGNGVLDGDEQCDDGNLVDGDGCDSNCTHTGCGNGIVTMGEQCDDGNQAGGDCCSASCTFEAGGSSCDDGDVCTWNDSCDGAGHCGGVAELEPSCLVPDPGTEGSRLTIKATSAASARLGWSWGRGPAIALGDLGSPTTSDDFALCVYVNDGMTDRELVSSLAPAGSSWTSTTSTLRYSSKSLAPGGIRQIQVKAADAGAAKIKIKGQGAALGLGSLGFGASSTVGVEMKNVATGACFGAAFAGPFHTDDSAHFDARTD